MARPWENQMPGVEDAEIGTTDLASHDYPWVTHTCDSQAALAPPQSAITDGQPSTRSEELSFALFSASDQPKKTAQEQSTTQFQPICEFVIPCMAGPSSDEYRCRKVVSHFFGRNKLATKCFPDSVWIWYCRKHYQRCRYRAAEWPFTQCEHLLQTLDRMEMWGQVRSFELRLRLRETRRRNEESPEPDSTTGLPERGRHSRTITAPVPEWLQEEVGADKSFDDIRHLIQRIRQYLLETERDQQDQQALGSTTLNSQGPRRGSSAHVIFPDIEIIPAFDEDTLQPKKPSSSARHTKSQSAGAQTEDDRAGEEASASRSRRQSQGSRPRGNRVSGRGTVRKLRDDGSQRNRRYIKED